eukprot:SAG31_NODE_18700_length_626_cov_1.000000_1_plen_193_part_01
MLARYPARATCLDQATLVSALPTELKANVELYLRERFPGSEEVCAILMHVVAIRPTALRVKELFETVEAAALIGRQIAERKKRSSGKSKKQQSHGQTNCTGMYFSACRMLLVLSCFVYSISFIFDSQFPYSAANLLRVVAARFAAGRVQTEGDSPSNAPTASVSEGQAPQRPAMRAIFDLACGHGLLGVLLAY